MIDSYFSKNKRFVIDNFLADIYSFFERKIKNERSIIVKNKYIKDRKNLLAYIIKNQKEIMSEINSKRNK